MTKWLTVLPVLSAIAIALVIYPNRPPFDSRLKTESWFGIHWLQPLQPVTKSLQRADEVRCHSPALPTRCLNPFCATKHPTFPMCLQSSSNSSFDKGPPAGSVPAQSLDDSYAPSAGGMCQLSGTVQDCCKP